MKNIGKIALLLMFYSLVGFDSFAQSHGAVAHQNESFNITEIFGLLEFPFLLLCIFFAFKTASSMKGGVFGKGMALLAWGFLVMAVGHFHMQLDHFFGYNLFNETLGHRAGAIVWFIALLFTWALSGLGFYRIYKASKGA